MLSESIQLQAFPAARPPCADARPGRLGLLDHPGAAALPLQQCTCRLSAVQPIAVRAASLLGVAGLPSPPPKPSQRHLPYPPPHSRCPQYCWFFCLQLAFTWVLILFGSAINLSFFRRTDYGFQFVFYLREWAEVWEAQARQGLCHAAGCHPLALHRKCPAAPIEEARLGPNRRLHLLTMPQCGPTAWWPLPSCSPPCSAPPRRVSAGVAERADRRACICYMLCSRCVLAATQTPRLTCAPSPAQP